MRARIVEVARSYLNTPFHHMGRSRAGLDCAGLLICVARDLGLVPQDFNVPNYTPNPDGRTLIKWCAQHMKAKKDMQIGDVIAVAIDSRPQHLGILGDYRSGYSIIHACNARSCVPPRVIETRLMFSRTMKLVAAFEFPGL